MARQLLLWFLSVCAVLGVSAEHIARRQATEAPAAATPAATPAESIIDCQPSEMVAIPDAGQYFANISLGTYPVWMTGGGPILGMSEEGVVGRGPALDVVYSDDPRHGWFNKRLWVIAGDAIEPVTIRGQRTTDGLPMWFDINQRGISTEAMLDPANPAIPVQHDDWREYPSYVYYLATGCYEITATWKGGNWSAKVIFVAPPLEATPAAATPTT